MGARERRHRSNKGADETRCGRRRTRTANGRAQRLDTTEEVQLASTLDDQHEQDQLANIFAIVVATESLENAYAADAITDTQCVRARVHAIAQAHRSPPLLTVAPDGPR